jgi:hypothetical protein
MLRAHDFDPYLWDVLVEANGNPEQLRSILQEASKEGVVLFYKEFSRAVRNLWQSPIAVHLRPHLSDDSLEDVLAYIVGQGSDYYDAVITHPEKAPRQVRSRDAEFLGIVGLLFWNRFNEEISIQ